MHGSIIVRIIRRYGRNVGLACAGSVDRFVSMGTCAVGSRVRDWRGNEQQDCARGQAGAVIPIISRTII